MNESMCPGHCTETDELRANVHPWVHVNLLVSVLAHFWLWFWLWDCRALQGRRRQQMAGAFCASAHFPRTLSSLFLSRALFSGFLVSRVKFTNPYGTPRASNELPLLSLSSTVFLILYLFLSLSRSLCSLFYFLFISTLFVLILCFLNLFPKDNAMTNSRFY